MRNPRQLIVFFLGAALLAIFMWGSISGSDAAPLVEESQELIYLPLILAPLTSPTATPTATETAMVTATSTPEETAFPTATTAPSETPTETAVPSETPTSTATATVTSSPTAQLEPTETLEPQPRQDVIFLPIIAGPPLPVLGVPLAVSAQPPIDFDAARQEAWDKGLDLAFNKIGFHIQLFGGRDGLQDYIETMDAAGVPVVLKTANDAEYVYKAQELGKLSGVDHLLIYRDATNGRDIPNYSLDPITAAHLNWDENRRVFPPELDPAIVWMETTNEPDRTKSAWLAEFALEQAKTAVAEGVRYAAFGWAGGEPEPQQWESPEMLEFLRFAGEHPDQVAVALHEYSFVKEDIGNLYPILVGRYQALFETADKHGIPRPTVLITEWGWEYNKVPDPQLAMKHIQWAAWLYAAYPQVKGAAIWTLGIGGGEFGSIGEDVLEYIDPLLAYSLSNYFLYSPGTRPIDADALAPEGSPVTPTPVATLTPTITPTPDPDQPLRNGNFEEGWETIQFGNQRPNFWQISWVQPGEPLYDSPDKATGVCECVHKLITQLPPEEQPGGSDPLILDGEVTYKMFSAAAAFGTELKQSAGGLTPGEEYRLTVPLRLHYDLDKETDPYAAETGVWVDDIGDWANLEDMGYRKWCKHEVTFTAPEDGNVEVVVRVKSKYPSYKDFFMDAVRLTPADEPPAHDALPLCDPTPEMEQYQPYEEANWLVDWIADLGLRISDIGLGIADD
jgi:hypothetical protein